MIIDTELLNMIRCPETGSRLLLHEKTSELWCSAISKAYKIKNGIPILIASQARPLSKKERQWLDLKTKGF